MYHRRYLNITTDSISSNTPTHSLINFEDFSRNISNSSCKVVRQFLKRKWMILHFSFFLTFMNICAIINFTNDRSLLPRKTQALFFLCLCACVRACSYYTPYSECKFMYRNLIKRKGILGTPAYIILAFNKNQISCRQNTLYFVFAQGWICLSKFFCYLKTFLDSIDWSRIFVTKLSATFFSWYVRYKSIVNEHSVFNRIHFSYAKLPFLCDS